ncbi:RNA-directed DNA polymerase, eukaryota, reverse transcriptase zinc-binding domain protein [Tanacetum coccineum]
MISTRFRSGHTTCLLPCPDSKENLKTHPKPISKPTSTHSHNQPKPASHSSHTNPNRSYATALYGKSSQNHVPKETVILKSVTLDVSDLIETCDMRNVILVKVRDVHLILNINNVLKNEGFYDFQSKYIRGMWLWIEFDSTESCQKLQSNKDMSWYFTQMKHVTQSFKVDERVVWIEIGGLPLNAWTTKAYKKIACIWGEPLFVDEDPHDNVAMGRVCIRTKIQGHITETCKVVIHGQSHNARVKEFAGWVPDIEAMDSLSGKNSEMGISDNHDDVNSDNGAQDAEEGEIRVTNEVNEENVMNSHHFSWADDEVNIAKDHDNSSPRNQPKESQKQIPSETSKAPKGDSETISKPPGFENFKPKKHQNSHQTSSSFPGAKSSRASKSHSKAFSNQGSMIEVLISQIEMGKVLGYDMEAGKCKDISKLCNKHNISFLGIQDTHSLTVDPFKVKCLWGNFQFDYAVTPSSGNWISTHMHCYMVNVYASQDDRKKESLWHHILDFKEGNPGHYIIFGDFNVVRFASERIGTIFNSASANVFNQFISDGHLWEIPHGGHLFTRINSRGDKLSKLDRFLITENSASHMHNYSAQVLDCHILDHRPIVLSASSVDFGPTPFKLYNSWLLDKHLHTIVTNFWEQHVAEFGSNSIVGFKNKMKTLKTIIKEWSRNRTSSQVHEKKDLLNKLKEFDAATVRGSENLDISQKAKVKWGIEADENSKFFHAIVNQKRRTLSIHGIKHEGQWLSDPHTIKDVFHSFFEAKFKKGDVVKIIDRSPFYKTLPEDQNAFLDTIKDDVTAFVQDFFKSGILPQGCNTSFIALILKISNPMVVSDFRPISLIGAQYKIIAKVMANRLAQVIDSLISHEQSAFIKHRQILDGPLMVNEVMCFMGFSEIWITWIKGCLYSATSSVLVNGSPTREFHINRGLRQGDPLSPFLFIIAMEGLHVAVKDAISAGLYRGLTVNTLTLSHFFFADDALFIGEWSRANIKSMASILECFHQVSGLKINFHKSNLVGVGVPFEEVYHFSQITGCNAMQSSFLYLGLPVDFRTTLLSLVLGAIGMYYFSLFPMPATVNNKLESLRSNFFWGSDVNGKKIMWISWRLVLAAKEKGGLGIGSLYSLNHALIQKWRWRFFNNPQALWVLLIKAIHGEHGDGSSFYNHVRDQGVWGRIVRSINSMHEKGLVPHSFLQRRVSNSASTKFWHETWMGDTSLKNQFPRLFCLALNKDCMISDCWNNGWDLSWSRPITSGTNAHHLSTLSNMLATCSLTDTEDTWTWSLGSPSFTVKSTRDHIDKCTLPDCGLETRWNRSLPKNINIFIWRAFRDRLPTRWSLSRKGIDLDSLTCPICDSSIKTTNHTLWFCSLATTLWHKIFVWLDMVSPSPSNIQDIYSWLEYIRVPSSQKSILEVICEVVLWSL